MGSSIVCRRPCQRSSSTACSSASENASKDVSRRRAIAHLSGGDGSADRTPQGSERVPSAGEEGCEVHRPYAPRRPSDLCLVLAQAQLHRTVGHGTRVTTFPCTAKGRAPQDSGVGTKRKCIRSE